VALNVAAVGAVLMAEEVVFLIHASLPYGLWFLVAVWLAYISFLLRTGWVMRKHLKARLRW